MIRVMIVDDEPYIRQGIKILINWEHYGFQVCGEAANGKEAVSLMEQAAFDLIITDIKMPQMDGLELIEYTREHISDKIRFIILSGYYEFDYAKRAIKNDVADYVLKPVQKDELIKVLEDYKELYFKEVENQKKLEFSEKIIFDRHLTQLISGKISKESIQYISRYLAEPSSIRYICIEFDPTKDDYIWLTKDDRHKTIRILYDVLKDHLGSHWYHAYIPDGSENEYSVGFIYVKRLSEEADLSEKEYISRLYQTICQAVPNKFILYIGQKVDNLEELSESYKSTAIAKNFQLFSKVMDIAYYDEIKTQINNSKYSVDKEPMDKLIKAIEENDTDAISERTGEVYDHFKEMAAKPGIIKINLDYLLFNLISIAKELDPDFDQEEVYTMISQGGYDQIAVRGSVHHFRSFALEFANYLSHLRQHAFGGVLTDIEKEISEHYMDNLSLKALSEKYYINSAYLGQIFKKQIGNSFKDYLNNYRIERAAELLIRSDLKVYEVATAVGFNNTDYFISKFLQIKGSTPLQYRKQFL